MAEGQHTQGLLWALEGAGLDVLNHTSRARRLAVLAGACCSPHLRGACGGMSAKRPRPSSSLEKVREQRVKVPVVGGEGRCRKDTCIARVWTPEAASWEAGPAG